MMFRFKPLLIIILTIVLCVFGFMSLLRGCLSKYDERSAIAPVLYFKIGKESVLFSLVKFEKANSYSRNGSFVRKTVNTSYYIQTNDARTGKKLNSKKIKSHDQVKNFPVTMWGSDNNLAWVFL